MGQYTIKPHRLSGVVKVPPSKSMAHRAIICASLAKGVSHITNIQLSDDINATIDAMKATGTKIEVQEDRVIIDGRTTFNHHDVDIDAHESGSTLRFMIPLTLTHQSHVHFTGQGQLGVRPLSSYYKIFDEQGISYSYKEGLLDLTIDGQLHSGEYKMDGQISSQFISGLLFALPLLEGDSIIRMMTPLQSSGYIDLTLDMLKRYGIDIINDHYQTFFIKGNQSYQPCDYRVEADYSQAAFFLVADAIGSEVYVQDLNHDSLQGDRDIIDFLNQMGAHLIHDNQGDLVKADALKAITVDASQQPDLMPVLAVAMAYAKGTSRIFNAGRLRLKECDRLHAITAMLNSVGIEAVEDDDAIIIHGGQVRGGYIETWHDHRMAMSAAILATMSDGDIVIDDHHCVKKSYPTFFEDYCLLEGDAYEC